MKNKTKWLSFNIAFPEELTQLYDFLQKEFNEILSDEKLRQSILSVDYTQHKGNVWRSYHTFLSNRVKTWPIKNRAWYGQMLYENIRREVQSKIENTVIFNELVNNDYKIDENLFNVLVSEYRIYPTRGRITNLKRSDKRPELAFNATFQLDYTVSQPQNFMMDANHFCKIQNMDGSWVHYQIILPASLNGAITNKIAKPRFFKRSEDKKYIGLCSYEYVPEVAKGDNILGVDIGLIKQFSAVALHKNGKYSKEHINSKAIENKNIRLKRLYKKKNACYEKRERLISFKNKTLFGKIDVLSTEYSRISNKIMNLKTDIARLVAKEVIQVAKAEQCNIIHIENLSWLNSQGGKWNHSQTHKYIEEASIRAGIKCEKVDAAYTSSEHPITGERGIKNNRTVTFSDNKTIDRDLLGALNIAKRNKGKKRPNKVLSLKKGTATPKRVKPNKSKRREIKNKYKEIKKNTQIVVFSSQSPSDELSPNGLWSLINRVQPNSSLLMRYKTVCQLVT